MNGTVLSSRLALDTKLYRTMPLKYLYELFDNRQNVLVRPKIWDDPFENLALSSPVESAGETGSFAFKDDYYGQCWTTEAISDAIWRIYSTDGPGVRVRSTVGQLLGQLADGFDPELARIRCFIGRVRYLKDDEITEFARKHFADGLDGRLIAESLLVKRRAFRHEEEVRLIYAATDGSQPSADLFRYSIDPHKMIHQIMVHPQLTDAEAGILKKEIAQRTLYKGEIRHSQLYRPPRGLKFIIGP